MFKRNCILYFIVIVFCITMCSKSGWKGKRWTENGVNIVENPKVGIQKSDHIRLVKSFTIGKASDIRQSFYRVKAVEIDSKDRIYVLDSGNFRVVVFDKEGNYLFEFGEVGSGPGEFREPIDMALDTAANIYVIDYKRRRIIKFDSTGCFLDSFLIQLNAHYIDLLKENIVLLSEMRFRKFGAFGKLINLKNKEILINFELSFDINLNIPQGTSISLEERYQILKDGHIYLSVPFPYEIRKYTLEGQLITKILKKDSRIQAPVIKIYSNGKGISIREKGRAGPCYLSPKGYLLNNCIWELENAEHPVIQTGVDFFDSKGRFICTLELPNQQRLVAIDQKDNLYLLEKVPYERIIKTAWIQNE